MLNSRLSSLLKAVAMLQEHEHDLCNFLTEDPKGRQLIPFFSLVANKLKQEREKLLDELSTQRKNIDYIKVIITTQQRQAKVKSKRPAKDRTQGVRGYRVCCSRQSFFVSEIQH